MTTDQVEFILPVKHDDLLIEEDDRYSVLTVTKVEGQTPDDIDRMLDELADRLHPSKGTSTLEEGPLAIYEHDNFDLLWSLIKQSVHLHVEAKTPLFEILVTGIKAITQMLPRFFGDDDEEDNDDLEYKYELRRYRNALKMYVLLLQWLISIEENALIREQSSKVAVKTTTGKGRGRKKAAEGPEDEKKSPWELEVEREKILSTLYQALLLDLERLWNQTKPEEQFINLFTKIAFQLLENPLNTKNKQIKNLLFRIVITVIAKYGYTDNAAALMMNMLSRQPEQIVSVLADLTEAIAKEKNEASKFVLDIIRQIGKLQPKDVAHNASGAKNYATFITEIAERLPKIVLTHISLLIPHLDYESPTMRMGIIQAIGYLIHKGFAPGSGELQNNGVEDNQYGNTHTRDSLLDVLLERFRDVWHHARSRVLQTWSYLVENKAVPKKYIQLVCEEAVGRLEDKTSGVRKNAIQLLSHLMEHNPIGPELPLENFKRNFENLKKTLEERTGHSWEALMNAEENPESEIYQDLSAEDAKQLKQAVYYHDAVQFIETLHKAVPLVCELLGSKNLGDVQEAIKFFVIAHTFKLAEANKGIRKMLLLVWSKENGIRDEVINAYIQLHLTPPSNLTKISKALYVAKNLIRLALEANLGELTSLEELLTILRGRKTIDDSVVKILWAIFAQKTRRGDKRREGRGALMILSMLANADPNIVRSKLNLIVNIGLGPKSWEDAALAKWSAIALQKLALKEQRVVQSESTDDKSKETTEKTSDQSTVRYSSSHPVFECLAFVIRNDRLPTSQWFGAAEAAINTIYLIAESPDALMEDVIAQIAKPLFPDQFKHVVTKEMKITEANVDNEEDEKMELEDDEAESGEEQREEDVSQSESANKVPHSKTNVGRLTRLLFVVGHTALKQLVYMEEILRDIKRAEESRGKKKAKKPKPKKSSAKRSGRGRKQSLEQEEELEEEEEELEAIEKELGITVAEGAEDEARRRRIEHAIVESNLLGRFAPIIQAVCLNQNNKYNDPHLRAAAVSALFKFMLVSPQFCDKNLQLLFSIFQSKENSSIRANICIALGDLAFRFPIVVEPWAPHIYARLRDQDPVVRKNTLMVLTHLILNDMIKAKGQISEMAMCLEDPDQRISDLARLFFHELSCKANAIYNIIPDIVSGLSVAKSDFDSVKNVIKYLLSFIDKDRQLEALVEKLCNRFPTSNDVKQYQYVAYCLSVLNWNERSIKKLAELYKLYKEALQDRVVHEYFVQIIAKARKIAKLQPDTKLIIDDLEKQILAVHDVTIQTTDAGDEEGEEQQAAEQPVATAATTSTRGRRKGAKATSAKRGAAKRGGAAKKAGGRRKPRGFVSDEDEDEDVIELDDEDDDDDVASEDSSSSSSEEESQARAPPRKAKAAGSSSRGRGRGRGGGRGGGRRGRVIEDSESDVDDDDDSE